MGDDFNTIVHALNSLIQMQGKIIEMTDRLSIIENKLTAHPEKHVKKAKRARVNVSNFEITKAELNDLVNVQKIPFTTLAKRFNVSDYGVRKNVEL